MEIELNDGILSVRGLKELDGGDSVYQKVRSRLPEQLKAIEVDLSQTKFLNCSGLGELIALQKLAVQHCGQPAVRVVNPPPPVQQMLELTRLHNIFEILKR